MHGLPPAILDEERRRPLIGRGPLAVLAVPAVPPSPQAPPRLSGRTQLQRHRNPPRNLSMRLTPDRFQTNPRTA